MEDKIKSKEVSKWAMILAFLIALSYNVFTLITTKKIPTTEEQQSILLFASSAILFFSPVYVSIWLEKIFGGKS